MKRKPLPSWWVCVKNGWDRFPREKPMYVADGRCKYCGKELSGRRTSFCSDECSHWFNRATVWDRGCGTYKTFLLYRDKFTCGHCGQFLALQNEHGVYMPTAVSGVAIHHIIPVSQGGGDEQENLITLCSQCHKNIHGGLK